MTWGAVFVAGAVSLPGVAKADPYADAFRVNNYTPGGQYLSSVAMSANGDSLLVWIDSARGGGSFLQRYDGAGQALQSDEWAFGSGVIDVAMNGNGGFALLRSAPDGSGNGVFVGVYDRSGHVVVPELRVNSATAGEQYAGAVAMNSAGQFAVVFNHGPTNTVYVKRYEANGVPVASEQVANSLASAVYNLDIGIDAVGNFVTVWDQVTAAATNNIDVYARRFAANGAALAPSFRVNGFTSGLQLGAQLSMNSTGTFVITWTSFNQAAPNVWGVYGQLFNAAGVRVGSELPVSVQTSAYEEVASVAMTGTGSFTVAWNDENRPVDPTQLPQILARNFDASGVATSAPFSVSGNSTSVLTFVPRIAMDPQGNALIGWRKYDVGSNLADVYARRYAPAGLTVSPLQSGQVVSDLSGAAGSWQYFRLSVPSGQATVEITLAGSIGNADLYVREGALPTQSVWDGKSTDATSNDAVKMLNFPAGDWYLGIFGNSAYASVSLFGQSY